MAGFRLGVTRYAVVSAATERQLAPEGRLTCRFGAARVYLVRRGAGAVRWARRNSSSAPPEMAAARDGGGRPRDAQRRPRAPVRVHARHAAVVRFEDADVAGACVVQAQWECVVPAPAWLTGSCASGSSGSHQEAMRRDPMAAATRSWPQR
jgi:hypothetical protein